MIVLKLSKTWYWACTPANLYSIFHSLKYGQKNFCKKMRLIFETFFIDMAIHAKFLLIIKLPSVTCSALTAINNRLLCLWWLSQNTMFTQDYHERKYVDTVGTKQNDILKKRLAEVTKSNFVFCKVFSFLFPPKWNCFSIIHKLTGQIIKKAGKSYLGAGILKPLFRESWCSPHLWKFWTRHNLIIIQIHLRKCRKWL